MSACVFALERITDLWAEMAPLNAAHYREVDGDSHPIKLDQQAYADMEAAGRHRMFTMRMDGELLGYCSLFFVTSPHDLVLEAHEDAIFIDPPERGRGLEFHVWMDAKLQAEGIKRVYRQRPIAFPDALGRDGRRGPLGYKPDQIVFARELVGV